MQVVIVATAVDGTVDMNDLRAEGGGECRQARARLMITYPSTHGVFEESIREVCDIVHKARRSGVPGTARNMKRAGRASPGRRRSAADVCHLNLHKTFLHPARRRWSRHGADRGRARTSRSFSAGPSARAGGRPAGRPRCRPHRGALASILPISFRVHIAMMGEGGLKARKPRSAILNANYIAKKLGTALPGAVRRAAPRSASAHELILRLAARSRKAAGIEAEDIAKRLMDYGLSTRRRCRSPVPGHVDGRADRERGPRVELDLRFCDAMIAIRAERQIARDRGRDDGSPRTTR